MLQDIVRCLDVVLVERNCEGGKPSAWVCWGQQGKESLKMLSCGLCCGKSMSRTLALFSVFYSSRASVTEYLVAIAVQPGCCW